MFNFQRMKGLRIIFLPLLLAVQGCNPLMIFRPDSEQIVRKGWARQPENQAEPSPLYCYHSLGQNDCYSAPLEKQDRLSGYYGPKP